MAEIRPFVFRSALPRRLAWAGAAVALAACASNELPPLAPPPPAPVAMPAPDTAIYAVRRGDTLTALARRAGVPVADLARMNNLANPNRLAVGQLLVVPAGLANASIAAASSPKAPPRALATQRRRAPKSRVASPPPLAAPAVPRSPGAQDRDRELVCIDAWIDEGGTFLRGARFEEAIESARKARAALAKLGGDAPRTARLEVVSASAEVALGRVTAADSSFKRALAADPTLRIDASTASPKVVRAFERAREPGATPRPDFTDALAIEGSPTAATSRF